MKGLYIENNNKTKLLEFFNLFLFKFSKYYLIFNPEKYVLKEFHNDVFKSKENAINNISTIFYSLLVLKTSLESQYDCFFKAKSMINDYIDEYDSDWIYYASTKRIDMIKSYETNHEELPDDIDEKGNIIFKKDYESLKDFTIISDLDFYCFTNNTPIEKIGNIEDNELKFFYDIIERDSADPFGMIELLKKAFNIQEINIKKFKLDTETGQVKELDKVDEIEMEIQYKFKNDMFIENFNKYLFECRELKKYYLLLKGNENNKTEIIELNKKIDGILNMEFL